LIKSRIEKVRIKREQDPNCPSVVIFIAPKKALLHQQIDYIKVHAAPISADEFHGDKKLNNKHIDLWNPREWSEQVSKFEVLGMTPAILQQLLETRKIPHHIIDLLILDECHYAKGGDPSKRSVVLILVIRFNLFNLPFCFSSGKVMRGNPIIE
jgi:ERCC4-related helicase